MHRREGELMSAQRFRNCYEFIGQNVGSCRVTKSNDFAMFESPRFVLGLALLRNCYLLKASIRAYPASRT
jgi:hypothetical protein